MFGITERQRERGDRLQTIKCRSCRSSGRGFVDGRHLRVGSDVRWRESALWRPQWRRERRVALPASVVLPVAGSAPS